MFLFHFWSFFYTKSGNRQVRVNLLEKVISVLNIYIDTAHISHIIYHDLSLLL